MKTYAAIQLVLEAMKLLEMAQKETEAASEPRELHEKPQELYCDLSGGYCLGFFRMHQRPWHIF